MADFRKALYAFALVVLIVGITVPASAQSTPTCNVFSPNSIMRAESYTDLMGDLLIQCTGGTPTANGQAVPAVTLTLFTDAPVTSKITDPTPTSQTAFTEALAIVDEPNSSFAFSAAIPAQKSPVLPCGAVAAPYDANSLGVCSIVSTGVAGATYNGSAGHPNVFQGRLLPNTGGTGIQFVGMPIDPPGPGNTLLIRITNIRINSVAVTGGNVGNANSGLVHATIGATTPNSLSFLNNTVQTSTIRNGLLSVSGTTAGPWPQCNPGSSGGSITVVEGFPSAFKTRNWANMQANGLPNAASDWVYQGTVVNPAADLNQNVPGAFYATESGFMYPGSNAFDPTPQNAPVGTTPTPGTATTINASPAPSTPFPTTGTGMSAAGTVSNGTRFVFVFSNVPVGSRATVPATVQLRNAQANAVVITGVMVNVAGADANGAGGAINTTTAVALSETGSTAVIYEVLFSNFIAIESATVPVTINPLVNLGANPPVNGSPQIGVTAVAQAGFAPFYAPGATPNPGLTQPLYPLTGGLPIPRFVNNLSSTFNLFSFTKCACDLLFPWVVGDGQFTTSIVVANTSRDPGAAFSFTGAPQTGRVTFWYYGTTKSASGSAISAIDVTGAGASGTSTNLVDATYVPQQSSILIPAGSYIATVVSPSAAGDTSDTALGAGKGNGIKKLPGNFAGYVISQAEFRYCHGVASINSNIPGFGVQTYIGLVMDNNIFNTLTPRTTNLGENFEQ